MTKHAPAPSRPLAAAQTSRTLPGDRPGTSRIDRGLLAIERSVGRVPTASLVALLMMLLAALRVTPGLWPTYLGKSYAQLSLDPFSPDPTNPVAYRILTPLLSYLVGLRGRGIIVTNLVIATVLLGLVYDWLRRRGHAPREALIGVSALGLSMVTLTTLHSGGYCDSLTYLLVFLMWRARERTVPFFALFTLALLDRESALFLAPWALYAYAEARGLWPRAWWLGTAGLLVAVAIFLGVRLLLAIRTPGVEYTASFYLRPLFEDPLHWYRVSEPHRWLGIFSAFNLYWVFPLLAVIHQVRNRAFAPAAGIVLAILGVFAQLTVAYDTSRMMTLAFMGVLLGVEYVLRTNAYRAREWAGWLAVVNFFVPQVNVAGGKVVEMR